ncbi:MAG: hypothetical protein ACQEXQ_10490 [Bacillota bacterium]
MKKVIGLLAAFTMIMLVITKSLYVEWTELLIIIVSLSVSSIAFNVYSKHQKKYLSVLISSTMTGYLMFWILAFIDLAADHFIYFLPTGNEDGKALLLTEKIQEYSDDLFIGSVISTLTVLILSSIVLRLKSRLVR